MMGGRFANGAEGGGCKRDLLPPGGDLLGSDVSIHIDDLSDSRRRP